MFNSRYCTLATGRVQNAARSIDVRHSLSLHQATNLSPLACGGLFYQSHRDVTLPSVREFKDWKWMPLKKNILRPLMKKKRELIEKHRKRHELPEWYHGTRDKLIKVVFIQNVDEFIAGQKASVPVGVYRNWFYPHKIALAATQANVEKYGHLNLELRKRIKREKKMKKTAASLGKYRMELRLKRDPNSNKIYTRITKEKIARTLLLFKQVDVDPQNITISRAGFISMNAARTDKEDDDDSQENDSQGRGSYQNLNYIDEEGSYQVKLKIASKDEIMSKSVANLNFEFRLNARAADIPLSVKHKPFDWESNQEEKMPQELRSKLNRYNRGKRAHHILDDLMQRPDESNSRYKDLYQVVKVKV